MQGEQNLRSAFTADDHCTQAMELLRSLIENSINPGRGLSINLYVDLAGILTITAVESEDQESLFKHIKRVAGNDNSPEVQDVLVAGVGFEPTTFGL